MNSPVAPLSTRVVTNFFHVVSADSISIFNLSELESSPAEAMVYAFGNIFSHLGLQILRVVTGMQAGAGPRTEAWSGIFSVFCTSNERVSESHIFASISKRLHEDTEGMPFTRCLVQNPLGLPLCLPQEGPLFLPCPF